MDTTVAQLKSVDLRIDRALDARDRRAFFQACRLRESLLRKLAAEMPVVVRVAS